MLFTASSKQTLIPDGILNNDSITVWVGKCSAVDFPVGIEAWHDDESSVRHLLTRLDPFRSVRNVENDEVLWRGTWWDGMGLAVGELEVIGTIGQAEHNSVEAVVGFELAEEL